ncbi:M4 family metallopeptidase [Fibrobacterota bacterium]
MRRLIQGLTAALTLLLAVQPGFAVRPSDRQEKGQPGENPFRKGLANLRKLNKQDLLEDQEQLINGLIGLKGEAAKRVPSRLNKKLAAKHSEVKVTKVQNDKLGNKHIRLMQFHRDIPVIGSDMVIHVNPGNEIYAVGGDFAPLLDLQAQPRLNARQVKDAALKGLDLPPTKVIEGEPRLVIFNGQLAFEVMVPDASDDPAIWKCFIQAGTGELLFKENQVIHGAPAGGGEHTVTGSLLAGEGGETAEILGWLDNTNRYFLYNTDSLWGVYNVNTSDWEQNTSGDWGATDRAAVSLAKNFEIVQMYVGQVLGLNSFNDAGAFARANVHEGTNYVNAYWDGSDFHFGDGDGVSADPLTVLDISAHEYGHAITDYSSNLIYSYESGALNESYSDILGTLVEFWAQPDGRSSYPYGVDGLADWLCGEDSWLDGEALRDLRDPQKFGQPSYYLGTYWYTGSGDNGGVHYNSGVQNFAYYLLSEGGTGTNDGHAYSITGIGYQAAGEIAMYANIYLLTSSSQYRDSREAWVLAATILGYDVPTVEDVWTACGVLEPINNLTASPSSLSFGSVGAGSSHSLVLDLSNDGANATTVTAMTFDNPVFSTPETTPFTVDGGSTYQVNIIFSPAAQGPESGQLTIASNADDNPSIAIALDGNGTGPAAIGVSPAQFTEAMLPGELLNLPLTVSNTGVADLRFTAVSETGSQQARASAPPVLIPGKAGKGPDYCKKPCTSGAGTDAMQLQPDARPVTSAGASNLNVLYLTTIIPTDGSDIFSAGLLGLSSVSGLDVLNGELSTPNLSYLQSYDVVVVSANASWSDPVLLGNTLADYADAGGKLILMVGAIANTGAYGLGGRIITPAYLPMAMAGPGSASASVSFVPHPITDGLSALSTDIPITGTSVQGTGQSLGLYNTGYLLGAYNPDLPVVAVNVFPSDGSWGGDLLLMVSNTFDWFDSENWLSVSPERTLITVPAGTDFELTVTINASELLGGVYSGSIELSHNDPATASPLVVPVELSISGLRRLSVSPQSVDFGNVWEGTQSTVQLHLENQGDEATVVSSIISDNSEFTCNAAIPLTVPPFDSVLIDAVFSPLDAGAESGSLTITSDAEDNPVIIVPLSGTGTQGPEIQVSPSSIQSFVLQGQSETEAITISNSGGEAITWSLAGITQGAAPPAAAFYDQSHYIHLEKGAADPRVGQPVASASGGPDNFGYTWKDSDEPGGPSYVWNDISGTGTLLSTASNCDDCFQSQALSFSMPFYGSGYQTIYVCSNGYLTFGAGSSGYSNYPLPSASMPADLVAGFYDDLTTSGSGDIYFQDLGDRAVIQFNNVPRLAGDATLTFQIVLEASGAITLYYQSVSGTLTSGTTGIQNTARDDGLTVAYNTAYVKDGLAVRIAALPDWLRASPVSGTIDPGGSQAVLVTLDAAGMGTGTYQETFSLIHNAVNEPSPFIIPVTMDVVDYTSGYSRILRIGPAATNVASGSSYHLWNLTVGGDTRGLALGSRYMLMLK